MGYLHAYDPEATYTDALTTFVRVPGLHGDFTALKIFVHYFMFGGLVALLHAVVGITALGLWLAYEVTVLVMLICLLVNFNRKEHEVALMTDLYIPLRQDEEDDEERGNKVKSSPADLDLIKDKTKQAEIDYLLHSDAEGESDQSVDAEVPAGKSEEKSVP